MFRVEKQRYLLRVHAFTLVDRISHPIIKMYMYEDAFYRLRIWGLFPNKKKTICFKETSGQLLNLNLISLNLTWMFQLLNSLNQRSECERRHSDMHGKRQQVGVLFMYYLVQPLHIYTFSYYKIPPQTNVTRKVLK